MGRIMKAKYDAAQNALRLAEPLEGVENDETVDVTVTPKDAPRPSILAFRGSLSKEAGESLARAVEELFPTQK